MKFKKISRKNYQYLFLNNIQSNIFEHFDYF